ncbi:antibiotic biosynthesis monooxygenase family protein [Pseudophaeobacter leonis]|uniref:antibiotic biosynthesis monooxygenase family protein n=1 Tax=Pseudophaeobacter leonis TaxID=1144477 RepID=UPI0009F4040A|nr:antibiotic biosynthesis monooxygenase [Pseudophaeobacter leonis]
MIAVIFEVQIAQGQKQAYLDVAATLRPMLEEIDGFLSVERFQSLSAPDKLLSLSFFRDEQAVRDWRRLAEHRLAQEKGRAGIFSDYRLKVAEVLRDYGLQDRDEAPEDSRKIHQTG